MQNTTILGKIGSRPYFRRYAVPNQVQKARTFTINKLKIGFALVAVFSLLFTSAVPAAFNVAFAETTAVSSNKVVICHQTTAVDVFKEMDFASDVLAQEHIIGHDGDYVLHDPSCGQNAGCDTGPGNDVPDCHPCDNTQGTTPDCDEPKVDTDLHLIKVVCDEYSDISGNDIGWFADDTGGKYNEFNNYNAGDVFSPLVSEPISPSEIPALEDGCERVEGWNFKASSDIGQTSNVMTYGPTVGTATTAEYVTKVSALTPALQTAINSGQFWVSEVEQEGYGFAAMRCYDDALNGDNLEFISLNGATPDDIYCIAYNVDLSDDTDLHFIKVVCNEYGDINGNNTGWFDDDTNGNFVNLKNYNEGNVFSPLEAEPVSPLEIPLLEEGCERVEGWNFKASSDIGQTTDVMIFGPTVGSSTTAEFATKVSLLPTNLKTAIESGQFWVSEVEQEGYGFATIRCYNDALNGDNLEFITLGEDMPDDIYCIAYNVSEKQPQPRCFQQNSIARLTDSLQQIVNGDDIRHCVISGFKFDDTDDSGTITAGDAALQNWSIYLDANNNGTKDLGELSTTTNSSGYYEFANLVSGTYHVREENQVGWTQVLPVGGSNEANLVYNIVANQNFLNTQDIIPCTLNPITNVLSGTGTQFRGLIEVTTPSPLSDEADYTAGVDGPAVPAVATGFIGAWDAAAANSNVSGATWVNNMFDQPNNPADAGGNGNVDSWRLFTHTFTIPTGAVAISSPNLYFTADNSVTVFLDDVEIGSHNDYATVDNTGPLTLTAGTHTLKFAVKNDAFNGSDNPTGLIYKLDTITYLCSAGGGNGDGDGGNTNGSGTSSSGSRRNNDNTPPGLTPPGQVLGDSTGDPSTPAGQVLGASTLPRTGTSTVTVLALLAILAMSGVIGFRILTPKKV